MTDYFIIAIGVILVNNFVLAKFLGLCPFIGVTQKMESAFGMGMAVTFVMTMASAITWPVYTYLLKPFNLDNALRTVAFILVIASFVQFVEIVMRKTVPALYRALGIFLPLITTNCAVMGVALLNTTNAGDILQLIGRTGSGASLSFLEATFQGFCAGIGFTIVMLMMAAIRERLAVAKVPKALQGEPIAFICTALMAMSFLGFANMVRP